MDALLNPTAAAIVAAVGLVWDRWIDPEGAELRRQEAKQMLQDEKAAKRAADAATPVASSVRQRATTARCH